MFKINDNYLKLPGSYLFSTIAKKVAAYTEANPDAKIIRLGIGDVTQPIAPAIIEKLHGAVDEMPESIPADPNVRNYSYTVVDDQVYYRVKADGNQTADCQIKGSKSICGK